MTVSLISSGIERADVALVETLDKLCSRLSIKIGRLLPFIDEIDQSDEEAVRVALRAGIAGSHFRDLRSYADLMAGALTEERIEAVIQRVALPPSKIHHPKHGYGTVLCSYRNSGSLGGWIYRAQFGLEKRSVYADQVVWVGGLKASRESRQTVPLALAAE